MDAPAFSAWQWQGDHFAPCDAVPLTDRAFRYGMALFESLRVSRSEPEFLDEHLDRLRAACLSQEFAVDERVFSSAGEVLRAAGRDGFARICITAGDGPVRGAAVNCRCFVTLETRVEKRSEDYVVEIASEPHLPLFGGLKTANYWAQIHALQQAQRRGCDEALLFNPGGELISACLANVFLVHAGELKTPALECGARAGVIRGQILRRRPVRECSLFHEQLLQADEIFLTNSWLGLRPVRRLGERNFGPSRIAAELAAELKPER